MYGLFCNGFMIKAKSLLDYTNLFSLGEFEKNDKIIYNYFKDEFDRKKHKSWL